MAVYDNDRLVKDSREGCLKSCALLLEKGRRFNDAEVMLEALSCWTQEIFRRVDRERKRGKPTTEGYELMEDMRAFAQEGFLRWLLDEKNYHPKVWGLVGSYLEEIFLGNGREMGWISVRGSVRGYAAAYWGWVVALNSGVFVVDPKGNLSPGPHFPKLNPEPEGVPIEKIGHPRTGES